MSWFSRQPKPAAPLAPAAPAPDTAAAAASDVAESLRECVVRISQGKLAREQIDLRAHLFDSTYIDSLSLVQLLDHIEQRFGVRLSEMQLVGRLCTLEALTQEIEAARGGATR